VKDGPRLPEAPSASPYCLEVTGRPGEALAAMQAAHELNPLLFVITGDVGTRYCFARQYDLAVEQYQRTLEMEPAFLISHIWLQRAYEQKGMHREAVGTSFFPSAHLIALSNGSPEW